MKLKLGLIEDDHIVRQAYETYFETNPSFDVIKSCDNMEDFLDSAADGMELDIVLTDIELPGMSGIEGIPRIRKMMPHAHIIMLTVFQDDDKIFKALCAGATGYLLKGSSIMAIGQRLLRLNDGGVAMSPSIATKVINYFHPKKKTAALTAKESQIVQALVDGLSYKMVADRLQISIHTVNSHIRNIYKKLHVNSKAEVVAKSLKGEI